jgi:sortase, SrtB family
MEKKKKKKRITLGTILMNIILLCAIGVFIYAASQLVMIFLEYKKGADEYESLRKFVVEGTASVEQTIETNKTSSNNGSESNVVEEQKVSRIPDLEIDFDRLQEVNSEVIGWIRVPAITEIDYPLVKGTNNEDYLHKTFEGNANNAGSIFVDAYAADDFSDRNTVIYGHNMKNLEMFGNLKRFHDKAVYDKNPYIIIYTRDKEYLYEIFSCHVARENDGSNETFFATEEDYGNYLSEIFRRSEYDMGVDVGVDDKMITLYTCADNDAARFLVYGKLVETRDTKK